MFRRLRPSSAENPHDDESAMSDAPEADAFDQAFDDGPRAIAPDLAALPVLGLTRRRITGIVAAVLATWIVIVFARQVGEASAATALADEIAAANTASAARVAALERELDLIAGRRYIAQQARGYGLGSAREIPFSLAPNAPALPADAPGSAALRVGADISNVAPIERWLTVLFGPST